MVSSKIMIWRNKSAGATLLEVLIAMVVMAFGLLGLAGLQLRLQVSEIEAYQRSQALMLLQDMAHRMAGNHANADDYVVSTVTPVGVGAECPTDVSSQAKRDVREWCLALQGATETAEGANVGVMIGARGCIQPTPGTSGYLVTVTWQGMAPQSPPPDSISCAEGSYDGTAGAQCTGDRCRRYVTTVVDFGNLETLTP